MIVDMKRPKKMTKNGNEKDDGNKYFVRKIENTA